jgi:hypothetical protein
MPALSRETCDRAELRSGTEYHREAHCRREPCHEGPHFDPDIGYHWLDEELERAIEDGSMPRKPSRPVQYAPHQDDHRFCRRPAAMEPSK